jgi:hypothetical protein
MKNVKLNEGFSQVCVWPGTVVQPNEVDLLVDYFKDQMDCRVQYLETIVTAPDRNNRGGTISNTGGRHDVLIAVHNDDVSKFAVPRLMLGIRWLEDIYGNDHGNLYPARVVDYMSWDGYKEKYAVTA